MNYSGWALFTDDDFLWLSDIAELLQYMDDSKAVLCVHHQLQVRRRRARVRRGACRLTRAMCANNVVERDDQVGRSSAVGWRDKWPSKSGF